MLNYFKIDCRDCLECCHFHIFNGEYLSFDDLNENFSFSKSICNTFFELENNLYFIDDACYQYKNNKCNIHNSAEYPLSCSIFPFLITKKNGYIYLAFDKNCPMSKNAVKKIKDEVEYKKLVNIIKEKIVKDEIIEYKKYKECGYKINILKKLFPL